jgi:hypothetical protein
MISRSVSLIGAPETGIFPGVMSRDRSAFLTVISFTTRRRCPLSGLTASAPILKAPVAEIHLQQAPSDPLPVPADGSSYSNPCSLLVPIKCGALQRWFADPGKKSVDFVFGPVPFPAMINAVFSLQTLNLKRRAFPWMNFSRRVEKLVQVRLGQRLGATFDLLVAQFGVTQDFIDEDWGDPAQQFFGSNPAVIR